MNRMQKVLLIILLVVIALCISTGRDYFYPAVVCPPGMYCPDWGMVEPRVCPDEHYCSGGSAIVRCPGGTYCPYYGMSSPYTCPSGSYCTGGSAIRSCTHSKNCGPGSSSDQ